MISRSRRAVPLKHERVSLDVYLLTRHALDALNDDDVERARSNLDLALRKIESQPVSQRETDRSNQ